MGEREKGHHAWRAKGKRKAKLQVRGEEQTLFEEEADRTKVIWRGQQKKRGRGT